MRESRSSGSVEGVMGNHDSYSDREFLTARVPVIQLSFILEGTVARLSSPSWPRVLTWWRLCVQEGSDRRSSKYQCAVPLQTTRVDNRAPSR
jgi:hypothetical protein